MVKHQVTLGLLLSCGLCCDDSLIIKKWQYKCVLLISYYRAGKSDVQVIVLEAQIFASQQRSLKEIIHIHFQELGISLTQNNEETTEGADCSDKVVQGSDVVVVLNKCDLIELDTLQKPIEDIDGIRVCILSCLTGEGMEKFLNILTEKVKDM